MLNKELIFTLLLFVSSTILLETQAEFLQEKEAIKEYVVKRYGPGMRKSQAKVFQGPHRSVKFNRKTEAIGYTGKLNLKVYEELIRNGFTRKESLDFLRLLGDGEECLIKSTREEECDPLYKYRTINGTCNNLGNPMWGSSFYPLTRIVNAAYADGLNIPRGGNGGDEYPLTLPNPRLISTTIHSDLVNPDKTITNMLPQFGQFLDHDISLVPEADKRCCSTEEDEDYLEDCWNIGIFQNDTFYSNLPVPQTCMPFTRSTPYCFPTESGIREQMNILTSYVDASNVYGSDEERESFVRAHVGGRLRTSKASVNMPPTNDEIEEETGIRPIPKGDFVAGDERVNEMPGLLTLHTLWMREHNHIADLISVVTPTWTDEEIYQETRRIVIAEMQNIVYGEYLPILLGEETMKSYGLSLDPYSFSEYDPTVDATCFHAFADAAYRFGHTFINGLIQLYRGNSNVGSYLVRENFFVSSQVTQNDFQGYTYILDGLLRQNAQTYDPFITEDLTNFILKDPLEHFGADLIARNLQRGREHGLAGYMSYREFCNLPVSTSWETKPEDVRQDSWDTLATLYKSPEDIDLFTGGLVEYPVPGALTGATFNCLKALQFQRLKFGDRHFFTHSGQVGSFSWPQLQNIRKRSLGDVMCDNSVVTQTQRNVFLTYNTGSNTWVPCASDKRAKLDIALLLS